VSGLSKSSYIYQTMYHAPKPEGIERRKAYIVGGGIGGLAAAAFLVDDAQMPGENITILESLSLVGGSMDGVREKSGYKNRGERELHAKICRFRTALNGVETSTVDR
jgi:oleate hydratase